MGSTLEGSRGFAKKLNAKDRSCTKGLVTRKSAGVLSWLNEAMDLHHKGETDNPLWEDGKALGEMWEKKIKAGLPSKDRHENAVLNVRFRDSDPFHATFTATTADWLDREDETSAQQPSSSLRTLRYNLRSR